MLTMLAAYLICGVVIGLLSGLFGIGGGVVGIPMLLHCFGVQGMAQTHSTHMAIGTMLAVAAATTGMAMYSHYKNGMVLIPLFKQITPWMIAGSLVGTAISSQMHPVMLQRIFAVVLFLIAMRAFLQSKSKENKLSAIPEKVAKFPSFCIGIMSGLLGLGGGVLLVPYLSWRGVPIKEAIATSTACILPSALVGMGSYMMMDVQVESISHHTGYIYWPAFIGVSVMSMYFAPIGARLTQKAPAPVLKAAFSLLVLTTAIHLATSSAKKSIELPETAPAQVASQAQSENL